VLLALLEYIDIRYIKVRERPDHRNAYTSPISRPPGKIPELRSDVEICGHLKASKPRSFLLCHRTSIEGVIVAEKPRSEITFHFHLWLSLFPRWYIRFSFRYSHLHLHLHLIRPLHLLSNLAPLNRSNSNSRSRLEQLVQPVPTLHQHPQRTQHSPEITNRPGDRPGSGRLGVVDEAEQNTGGEVG
jgi:hypothetical protein